MDNSHFAKTNILNSKSLDDVKNYAVTGLSTNYESGTHDYFGTTELMNAHLWEHEHFNYTFNEYGFREGNFPSETGIGAFGCSFTFGSGLPKDKLWHSLLAQYKNCSSLNFGLPSRSIASAIDIFLIVSKHIKMKSAVFLFPAYTRTQIASMHPNDSNIINYVDTDVNFESTLTSFYGIDSDTVYRALPDEELFKIARDKLYLLDHVASLRNINVYVSSWEEKTYQFLNLLDFDNIKVIPRWQSPSMEFAQADLARDRLHPGMQHHKLWAEMINSYIN